MNRRGFLKSMLALGMAPAIVRADSLMKIAAPAGYVETESGLLVQDQELFTGDIEAVSRNGILTINQITQEALQVLESQLTFAARAELDEAKELTRGNSRTISIRIPRRAAFA